jgi:hypothetical protein
MSRKFDPPPTVDKNSNFYAISFKIEYQKILNFSFTIIHKYNW